MRQLVSLALVAAALAALSHGMWQESNPTVEVDPGGDAPDAEIVGAAPARTLLLRVVGEAARGPAGGAAGEPERAAAAALAQRLAFVDRVVVVSAADGDDDQWASAARRRHFDLPSLSEAADARTVAVDGLMDVWLGAAGAGEPLFIRAAWTSGEWPLSEPDRAVLAAVAERLAFTFESDLARRAIERGGATWKSSDDRESTGKAAGVDPAPGAPAGDPRALFDNDASTSWRLADEEAREGWAELRLAEPMRFDRVRLTAMVAADGDQRAEAWRFRLLGRTSDDDEWKLCASGKSLGSERTFVAVQSRVRRVRLVLEGPGSPPEITSLGLFLSPPRVSIEPRGAVSVNPLRVTLATREGADVRFTLDGSPVTLRSTAYTEPVLLDSSCTLRARAFDRRGRSPIEASSDFRVIGDDDWHQAVTEFTRKPVQGLRVEAFDSPWTTLDEMPTRQPITVSNVEAIDPAHATRKEQVALRYSGYLEVPRDGLFTLSLASDDGSRLRFHGEVVLDNDGEHPVRRVEAKLALRAGKHPFVLEWFNAGGPGALELRWRGPGVPRDEIVPKGAFWR